MRKFSLFVFLIAFISTGILFFSLISVKAAVNVGPGGGWATDWSCDPTKGFLFRDAQDMGVLRVPYDDKQGVFEKKWPNKCVKINSLGSLHDLVEALMSSDILICKAGTVVGNRSSVPADYTQYKRDLIFKKNGYEWDVCCPISHSIINDEKVLFGANWKHYRCCTSANGKEGDEPCDDLRDPQGLKPESLETVFIDDPNYFYDAEEYYNCPMENCLMRDANTPAPATDDRNYLLASQIGPNPFVPNPNNPPVPKLCIASSETAAIPGSSPNLYCISGTILDQDTYNQWKDNLTTYIACKDFKDPLESQACLECVKDQPSRVYSSLGCIDTERNALIIRIMQIGIGIVGGIGVLRLMQAAILRQTADPAKIQESWDIISSVIIGLIILLGSVVILRVLGINVLGLLPFDY